MTSATKLILDRLHELKFSIRHEEPVIFGEQLPLVTGIAWDDRTAQLALIAESSGEVDPALWRQLLFAGSGIRHQLSGDGPSAFGTPLILAVVDEAHEGEIRALAEDLVKSYAVFNRVDLNILSTEAAADPQSLDDALAPLLPKCRSILGEEISKGEVQKFWGVLREEIEKAAENLDETFGSRRSEAGRRGADALIGDSAEASELPAPSPISKILLRNFRSVAEMDIDLAAMNIIYGPNGGGKTSVVEAMELGWARTSQRIPEGVTAAEYQKHLPTGGDGDFSLEIDGEKVTGVAEKGQAELARCVLTHEAMSDLVSDAPEDRFSGLLKVTGLEIPDLKARTGTLLDSSKVSIDRALMAAGIAPLGSKAADGLKHLKNALGSAFLRRFTALPELDTVEKSLAVTSGGNFTPHTWKVASEVSERLGAADSLIAEAYDRRTADPDLITALESAKEAVGELLTAQTSMAAACRRLIQTADQEDSEARSESEPEETASAEDAPIDVALATRWLAHSEGLKGTARRFQEDSAAVEDGDWSKLLDDYSAALLRAAEIPPAKELRRLSEPRGRSAPMRAGEDIDEDVYRAVGFSEAPSDPAVLAPLRELAEQLRTHVDTLQQMVEELTTHPARQYGAHADQILDALCDYELARALRREGPIMQASETLIGELLDKRLAPVVRELVAAIVRFEWYFKPLLMSADAREIVLAGLATSRKDLDARLVLNSAEKTIVGLAWFLALHMLQPKERRRVLVLDDPTAGFDKANQAGFTSTLRAFTRLLKPEQIVVTTHDDAIAALLVEEFITVADWPGTMLRLRVQRDECDFSVAKAEATPEPPRRLVEETKDLGLLEDATASS